MSSSLSRNQLEHLHKILLQIYDATVKMGIPARTLEGTASYSSGRQTSAVDTSFSWDAGRDDSKQVGFKGKLTSGDKTKADVTFHLPAIGKVLWPP